MDSQVNTVIGLISSLNMFPQLVNFSVNDTFSSGLPASQIKVTPPIIITDWTDIKHDCSFVGGGRTLCKMTSQINPHMTCVTVYLRKNDLFVLKRPS